MCVCGRWVIPTEGDLGEITLALPRLHTASLTQGEATIEVSSVQLRSLVDKIYWLDELHRADLQEALMHFCGRGRRPGEHAYRATDARRTGEPG
jgi:hypothetical protein